MEIGNDALCLFESSTTIHVRTVRDGLTTTMNTVLIEWILLHNKAEQHNIAEMIMQLKNLF